MRIEHVVWTEQSEAGAAWVTVIISMLSPRLETWQQIIIAACETLLLGIGRIGHAADTTDSTNNSLLVVHIRAVCSVLST